jgi:hypothetical protein
MAQHRIDAARHDRRQEALVLRQAPVSDGVDLVMDGMEAPRRHAVADRLRLDARAPQLIPLHQPSLIRRKDRDPLVDRTRPQIRPLTVAF